MVRVFFILMCGFIIGAIVVENKQYFSNNVAIPVTFLPDGGQYDGDLLKGELNGNGRIVWPNGDVYKGEFKKGLFHGDGRYETKDFIYEGEFDKGVAKGKGIITFADERVYEGDVDFAKANGQGIMSQGDAEYIGEFKNNVFHGQGKLVQSNGDIYEGNFLEGMFDGQGLFTSADGKVYQGEFKQGAMLGRGDYRDDEVSYTGNFKSWLFDGQGEYKDKVRTYTGEFVKGAFHGAGVYSDTHGVDYKGEFVKGVFHGQGIHEQDGARYEGGFEYGVKHGQGILTHAKPLDGIARVEGIWQYGQLVSSDNKLVEHDASVIVEDVLYHQSSRVDQMLSAIEENDLEETELYFVGIAGDGTQGVFRREVNFIRDLFDSDYGTRKKSLLLMNGNVSYKEIPLATTTSIETALHGVAEKMDAENDILFVYFTSHGSRDFNFQLAQPGLELSSLSAERMGEIINSLPVRYKVVVISACFAGGYVNSVKDDNTLVVVAASEDKTSFGCSDTSEMTYFGEAFFKDALPVSDDFVSAFDRARDIVRGREAQEDFEHSNPLIFKPKAIVSQLAVWREALAERKKQENRQIP